MAQQATVAFTSPAAWNWRGFSHFVKSELAPYPGRWQLVARMTVAATLMMLCIMTFRMPGAALGAYYTLVISRANPARTRRSRVWSGSSALSLWR